MKRSATFRRTAWLIMAALLVQPWLGRFLTATASEQLNAMVICTSGGFKVVYLSDDANQPADQSLPKDASQQGQNCTACLVQALGQLDVAAMPDGIGWQRSEIVKTVVADQRLVPSPCPFSHQSRAPPRA